MKPTLQDIRYDPILSNVSLSYQNAAYIANLVCPLVPVKTKTGKYYQYDKSKFREVESLRGMGASAAEVGYNISQSTAYVCLDHALKQLVPVEMIDQSLTPLAPQIDAAENVMERLLVEREYALATYMQNSVNLTNGTALTGTNRWSDYANSDPIGDIETGIESIRSKIFKPANTLVLGQEVYNQLKHHPDIVDRLKYSGFGKVTTDILATLFDVNRVIIGAAGRETATEGANSSIGYIWGKYAWLLYVEPRPGIRKVSFAYHFQYKPTLTTDKWYDKDREGTWVRVHDFYTRETLTVDAAYLIKTAVA